MRYLMAILDALVGIVQRNPLTVLIIVILAIGAPALLKGIALFVLYVILGIAVLFVAMMFFIRWRIYKMRKQMQEPFDEQGQPFGGQGFRGFSSFGQQPRDKGHEGDVKVYKTSETPEKRVSKDVGDYVDFEETKE